jgi:hypothetical protein
MPVDQDHADTPHELADMRHLDTRGRRSSNS